MPPKKKVKRIVINKQINDVLDTHFGGEISLIKNSKLTTLYDEGIIKSDTRKFLIAIKKAYNKSQKGEYELKIKYELDEPEVVAEEPADEPAEEPADEPADLEQVDADDQSEASYSPDSPREDEQGQILEYDDPENPGKYLTPLIKESKYIVPHRKAFVDFVNSGFYKEVLNETKGGELNVYQVLVKEYLSIDTPYRGLLVYHGLGTGKTATAVSMAESVSSDMEIVTLLPASLENNFVGEVKRWGKNELDLRKSLWTFHSVKEIDDNPTLRKKLKKDYGVTMDTIKEIYNHTVREVKKKISFQLIKDEPEIQENRKELMKRVNEKFKKISSQVSKTKGFWTHDVKKGEFHGTMEEYPKLYLECQVHRMIQLKYNFIHYNPLPPIKRSDQEEIKETEETEDDELFEDEIVNKRTNEAIKKDLMKRAKYNLKNYDVESPFYNQTIIIDEVHNFVREILNNSGSARIFYEWIVNAEKVKLVFLSGTPIINVPCEIAILYNMLKGRIKIFNFTINSDKDPIDLTTEFNDIFYKKKSSIELFHISRKEGKLIFSFTQNQESFASVMNPDNGVIYTSAENSHSYKDFISDIYDGLSSEFKEDQITPSKREALNADLDETLIFDKSVAIPFHKKQTLFEINDNNELIDLTQNEVFMKYFFTQSYDIEDKKKTLLRRMLMGLTSYYPIDRSKIGTMPTITTPIETEQYQNYLISQKINVETCVMSNTQFSKYVEVWRSEKKKDLVRQMRRHLHEELPFDFNIRTRQVCNMIYADDEFRYIKDNDRAYEQKMKQYETLKQNKSLLINQNLSEYSPKIYKMMKNIQKFLKTTSAGVTPSGKVLIYSDFRGDAGAEIVEQTLKINGYSLYDPSIPITNSLKYTFITGEESPEKRKANMEAFNSKENRFGEQIQIMIISGAGAEGISLTCVRQVHILEPYWNFVRIDQVFGRAIRLHSHDDLDVVDRNVEQYIYLAVLPSGRSIEDIYNSIKDWSSVSELSDIKKELAEGKNKDVKEIIDMIVNIGQTSDQKVFDIMERKYKVSQNIIDIIKESSLDCIQHTRDDPETNERCIRFSNQLLHEISYFPGISASELFEIDQTQLKASFQLFVEPKYMVLASGDDYIYYEIDPRKKDTLDLRYLRENSKKVAEVVMNDMNIYTYVSKEHDLKDELGKQFSVYQDVYSLEPYYDKLIDGKFPSLDDIVKKEKSGYKVKYNINEMMFFSPNEENTLRRLYRFEEYIDKQITKALILCDGGVYIEN